MNESPSAPATSPDRAFSLWRNWISLAGGIVAAGALFAFLFLFVLDLSGRGASNPYLGILCYVVAPGFLILGMAIAGAGAWLEARHRRRGISAAERHLSIDLARPRDRRILVWFSFGTMTFLLMTAVGSYQTFVYTESNQFCGEVCHAVMGPEYSAYRRSPHAKIACVECHVGSGATSYVKAKVNGTHQLIGVLTGKYSRPITTPVKNMRPADETCAQCHWPKRYVGSLERTYHRYLADEKNTPYTVRMLVNVGGGGGGDGPAGGIHWHMNVANRVEYFASDAKRQAIPWVRVTGPDGSAVVYRTADFKGEPPAGQIRRMDCIDCHNRPAHRYQSPNDAVDEAIYLGHIDAGLPSIKRTAVEVLTRSYPSQDAARAAISEELHRRYPATTRIVPTIAAVQAIYTENFFPEMKADWSKYPDNSGHLDSAGCFRCHDGKHLAVGDSRRMPATDCNTCHTILAQGSGAELAKVAPEGQAFRHPSSDIDGLGLLCNDCHNGKNQEN
ncbi:MAG TPA: NapC/NirT family cytochrome c [Opitutaceae bacterium]|nr:NapC/NirT family cytochrome c [Opitutaceae bacterium]